MDDKVKIRVNLSRGEIEFEGNEEFVKNQLDDFENLFQRIHAIYSELDILDRLGTPEITGPPAYKPDKDTEKPTISGEISVPAIFGEWYNKFPKDLSNDDTVFIAGYFAQVNSDDNEFKTSDVSKLLKEYGIKIANPSQYLGRLMDNKLIFLTHRTGATKYFRVIKPSGIDKLKELMQKE
jgi:hypothetical protein